MTKIDIDTDAPAVFAESNPTLDLLRRHCGSYNVDNMDSQFTSWACGPGVAFTLSRNKVSEVTGVIGLLGSDVECFAQFGLPTVTRMVGRLAADSAVDFWATDPMMSFYLRFEGRTLHLNITAPGQEEVAHVLTRF